MSESALNNFKTDFDTQLKHDWRLRQPALAPICKRRNVNAKIATFNRAGILTAQQKLSSSPLQFQDLTQNNVTATVLDYYSYALSDEMDILKMEYDERKELAVATSIACVERMDQLIINALEAGASATTYGADNVNLTIANLANIDAQLNAIRAPKERFLVLHALSARRMLTLLEATSSDYTDLKLISEGGQGLSNRKFMGFNVILMGNYDTAEGGMLYNAGTGVRTNYVVCGTGVNASVGLAVNLDIQSKVAMMESHDAYKVGARFSAGSVVIGSVTPGREGVYKYFVDELA